MSLLGFVFLLILHFAKGGPCDSIAPVTTSWPGGYTIQNLLIPVISTVSNWTISITFTSSASLQVWNAGLATTDNIHFQLRNLSYNGPQTAGSILNTVGFNVAYNSTLLPNITSVLFNGVNVCSTPPSTTTIKLTTSAATTKAVTTPCTPSTTKTQSTTTPVTTKPTTTPVTTKPSSATQFTSTTTSKNPTTTVATTTAKVTTSTLTSTTKTTSSATSSTPLASCVSVVSISAAWPGGSTIYLNIPVAKTVTSWTISLTFSSAITSLQVWNAGSTTSDSIHFQLANLSYNGQQISGTILSTVGFNIAYSSSTSPNIISVLFNGVNVCVAAPNTTTPVPTSSSTKSGTTTTAGTTTKPISTTTGPTIPTTTTIKSNVTTVTPSPLSTKYNYAEVLNKSLLFYYAQRSGHLPVNDNPISYRFDSALSDVGQNGEDLTGGYYDAGDFVKFGFPMAGTTTIVAWSIIDYQIGYSSAGKLTTAQNMVKWATDYFIKAHVAPNKFYGQVGDGNADHSYWGRPEQMTMARPAYYISTSSPGSDLAGETAAALAAASMVFSSTNATYSALCLSHAKQLYSFAKQYLGIYSNSISAAAAFYSSSGYGDELTWAAIWLYRATLESTYLNDAITFYTTYGLSYTPGAFSWDDKTAGVQVLMAKMTGGQQYLSAAQSFCDARVSQSESPKGLIFISPWGSLRYSANIAYICLQAADLNLPNSLAYRQLSQKQIHYALGDTGRSFVGGFGTNPPVSPHHRSSSCPNMPSTCDWNTYSGSQPNYQTLYGALVGGPGDGSDGSYVDSRSNYQVNEVACDYNAGFQGAVAALQYLAVRGIFH